MPPPVKKPQTKVNADQALILFAQNLEEMRRWYRSAATPGNEAGVIVVQELVFANVSTALDLALRGERWERPKTPPQ